MFNIDLLEVTHNSLRHRDSLREMVQHVENGGFWDEPSLKAYAEKNLKHQSRVSPPIQLSEFEDGRIFIHDGHHRTASVFLAGRKFLANTEYVIARWRYYDYMVISHENGWYTPFDPRTHCRIPDFGEFKATSRQKFNIDPDIAIHWIKDNQDLYCESRKIRYVSELVAGVIV